MAGKALWPLPADPDPAATRCVVVRVPNDREHIAAFMGALYELTLWLNWERDDDHTGKIAADRWLDIWRHLHLGECGNISAGEDMQFRQNGCKLEYSIDCETWYTLYDPTDCIAGMVQPSGGGLLHPEECREYDAVIPANGLWFLPFPVYEGYTIEVTNPSGAWTDTTVGGSPTAWYCPSGASYLLGACVGEGGTSEFGAEPDLTYMAVLSRIDASSPVWFESLTGIQTVGSGLDGSALWFQPNLADQSLAQGAVKIHVKVCAPAEGGCLLVTGGDGVTATNLGNGRYSVYCPVNASSGGVDFASCSIQFADGATPCCKIYQFESMAGWTDNNDSVSNQGEYTQCDDTNTVFEGTFSPDTWIGHWHSIGADQQCVKSINVKSLTAFTAVFAAYSCAG